MSAVDKFINDQLSVWPLAAANFRALKQVRTKTVRVNGLDCTVQHNPERIASSTAEISPEALAARPCFLCEEFRPKEQYHIKFEGRKGRRYNVQVNPYPIFPGHLVIARDTHTQQSIWHNFVDAMDFARKYPEFAVFYNGPQSGASAPDHMHWQAVPQGLMPLQRAVDAWLDTNPEALETNQDATVHLFRGFCRGVFAFRSDTPKSLAKLFYRVLDCAPRREGDDEPRLNLFVWVKGRESRAIAVLRGNLRSHHYYAEGAEHLTMSPGAADMAGYFVAPCSDDFDKVGSRMLEQMMDEVSISPDEEKMVLWRLTRRQRKVDVRICTGDAIRFEIISDGAGPQTVSISDGRISYGGALYDQLEFDRVTRSTIFAEPSFIIYMQDGPRKFAGLLKFVVEDGSIAAYNHVGVENYLLSTVSQDESAPKDFNLLCQTVTKARSRVLNLGPEPSEYFGLTVAIREDVRRAIDLTWGQTYNTI